MKKVILLTVFLLLLIGGASYVVAKRYTGNKLSGEMVTQSHFSGKTINAVAVGFVWDVILTQGDNNGVELSFPKEYQKYVIHKMEGDKLILGFENLPRGLTNLGMDTKFTAKVSVASLRELKLSGSSNALINGTITANSPQTHIVAGGSSDIKGLGKLICAKLEVACTGSSDFKLNAIECSGDARITCSGSSDFKTTSLTVGGNAEISVSGSSDFVSRLVCEGDASLNASGASDLKITGSATTSTIMCSGSSDYQGSDFRSKEVRATVGGASNAHLFASERAEVSVSGSSDAYIYGKPKSENFKASGSSDIHKR